MIRITAISGPHAGKTRVPPEGMNPISLLADMAKRGWEWKIDFSRATEGEVLLWGRADMAVRILRALSFGRVVVFEGVEYRVREGMDVSPVAQEIEDVIANSGRMVRIENDDDSGVVIGCGETENRVQ